MSPRTPTLRPELEPLEPRIVPARKAVLDFDGGDRLTLAQVRQGGWNAATIPSLPAVSGFRNLFTAARPFLDLDRNGAVNGADADIAIARVVDTVRGHYAPYDLEVWVGDHDAPPGVLTDARHGDVVVFVTGGADVVTGLGALGVAPSVDHGNDDDEIVWAFGLPHATRFTTADQFLTQVAVTVSHEMGHAFGLAHILPDGTDAARHHLMNAGVGDASRNSNFQDLVYDTPTGRQNAHEILSRPGVLGPSPRPWAAVLRPGTLTLQGSGRWDRVNVRGVGGGDWSVEMSSTGGHTAGYAVDPSAAPDIFSINPFSTALSLVTFQGRDGDDLLEVSSSVAVPFRADGGDGRDTLHGGAGRDTLNGQGNDDQLFGQAGDDDLRGEDGQDILAGGNGNDTLRGGNRRDLLIGGRGADQLEGNDDQDLLIAGATAFDGNPTALTALLAEWNSGRSYGRRVDNLLGRGTGERANGSFFLVADGPGATVFDDGAADTLTGGNDRDWFFANRDGGVKDDLPDLDDRGGLDDREWVRELSLLGE